MKRHQRLSLRQPEATSQARAAGCNYVVVHRFQQQFQQIMADKRFPAHRMFNGDETSTPTVFSPIKVVAERRVKQVMQTTYAERGQNVTMLAFCNFAGEYIPLIFLFPLKKGNPNSISGCIEGSLGLFNGSGWMDGENFLKSMQHFQKHVKSCESDPVLLTVDNHASHLDYAVVKCCNKNYITLLIFPPHCSHVLQPEGVGIYGLLKNYFAAEQQEWLRTHPGQRITIHHIAELSRKPFFESFHSYHKVSSFEKTGIYPLKEFLPDDIRFIPSIVTDLPPAALDTNSQPSSSQQIPCSLELNNSIDNHVMEEIDHSGSTLQRTPFRPQFSPVENDKDKSSENSKNSIRAVSKRLTFLDIMPLPQVPQGGPRNSTRSRKGDSREATSPLEVSLLEEQHLRKVEKEKDRLARVAAKADRVKSKTTKQSNKENILNSPLPEVCSTNVINLRKMSNKKNNIVARPGLCARLNIQQGKPTNITM